MGKEPRTNDQRGFILSPSSVLVAIPVPFSQLPALLMMPITRANPASTLIGRVVPASRHPLIATSLRRPVAIDPGIARTRNGTASLVANPRRRMSYVHGDLSCGGHSKRSGEQYTADQIQFHFCSSQVLISVDKASTGFSLRLGRGVFLTSDFDTHENSKPHEYESAYHHPLSRHVH